MPRRTEPRREIGITIDEESIRDAMALWVKQFHGIEIDARKIEIKTDDNGLSATFTKKPETKTEDEQSTDDSGNEVGVSPGQE